MKKTLLSLLIVFMLCFVSTVSFAADAGIGADGYYEEGGGATENATQSAKDTLTVCCSSLGNGWDPMNCGYNIGTTVVTDSVYEGLLQSEKDGSLTPVLATGWEIDEDGLGYTFHLREGVTFTNGEPFNADAVVWSMGVRYPSASLYAGDTVWDCANISKVDDYTVHIPLQQKNSVALYVLANQQYRIMEKTWCEAQDNFNTDAMGTGPYMIEEAVSGSYVKLTANENYWGVKPAIKKVTCKYITESSQEELELEVGTVDCVLDPAAFDVVHLMKGEVPGIKITYTYGGATMIVFNLNTEMGQNTKYRQALSAAIDRESIAKSVFQGLAKPMYGFALPSSIFYDPDYEANYPYKYNLENAKALLAESGLDPSAITLKVLSDVSAGSVAISEIISHNIGELGFNVDITMLEGAAYVPALLGGEEDIAVGLGLSVSADPTYNLRYAKPGASPDWTGKSKTTTEFDAEYHVYNEMIAAGDEATMLEKAQEYQNFVTDNCLFMPLVSFDSYIAHVDNLQPGYFNGNYVRFATWYFK